MTSEDAAASAAAKAAEVVASIASHHPWSDADRCGDAKSVGATLMSFDQSSRPALSNAFCNRI